jgi:hypothetical protein
MRCAVILAGGSGTRLWPASRRDSAQAVPNASVGAETLLAGHRAPGPAPSPGGRVTGRHRPGPGRAGPGRQPDGRDRRPSRLATQHRRSRIGLAAAPLPRGRRPRGDPRRAPGRPAHHRRGRPGSRSRSGAPSPIGRARRRHLRRSAWRRPGPTPATATCSAGAGADPQDPGVRPVERFVEKPDRRHRRRPTSPAVATCGTPACSSSRARATAGRSRAPPAGDSAPRWWRSATAPDRGGSRAAAAHRPPRYRDLAASVSIDHGVMERTARRGRRSRPRSAGATSARGPRSADLAPGHGPGAGDAAGNAVVGDAVVVLDGRRQPGRDRSRGPWSPRCGVSGLAVVRAGDAVLVTAASSAPRTFKPRSRRRARAARPLDRYL